MLIEGFIKKICAVFMYCVTYIYFNSNKLDIFICTINIGSYHARQTLFGFNLQAVQLDKTKILFFFMAYKFGIWCRLNYGVQPFLKNLNVKSTLICSQSNAVNISLHYLLQTKNVFFIFCINVHLNAYKLCFVDIYCVYSINLTQNA